MSHYQKLTALPVLRYEFGHRKRRFILTVNVARGQLMRRTAMAAIAASGLALTAATAEETPTRQYAPADSTFSIIAVEKDTGLLGLGVQSKALSIGNRVDRKSTRLNSSHRT